MANKKTFLSGLRAVISSSWFQDLLETTIVRLLKLQMLGGLRGWILKVIVREFTLETVEIVNDTLEYFEIKAKVSSTIENEDRDEATDNLNSIFH